MLPKIDEIAGQVGLQGETKEYLKSHPELAEYFRLVETTFGIFGNYLRLTQPRIIIRELPGSSNAEADLSAALSRTNR